MAVGAALACLPLAGRAQSGADDSTGTGMATASIATGIPSPCMNAPATHGRAARSWPVGARGLCLLCHRAPIPEERFQGDIGPDLAGAGDRWTSAQLRLRLADPQRLNPGSLMRPISEPITCARSRRPGAGAPSWQPTRSRT